MSLRVLHLVTTERPFFRQQVEALEAHGVEQTVLSVPNGYDPANGEARTALDYLRFYPRVLRESLGAYDLIHANTVRTAPHALAQPALPVVTTFWGKDVLDTHSRQRTVSKWCAKVADSVVVPSTEMADELGGTVHVVPHGIDLGLFQPADRLAAKRDVGWDEETKHVLFPYVPARAEKNHSLAAAVVETVDRYLDVDVELQVVHGQPHDQMPRFMNAADALLLTSAYEGGPVAVKEALACNLPVVSTDVGDVSERVAGVDGAFVGRSKADLTAALATVLASDIRCDGRAAVEHLTVDDMAAQLVSIYESVAR